MTTALALPTGHGGAIVMTDVKLPVLFWTPTSLMPR